MRTLSIPCLLLFVVTVTMVACAGESPVAPAPVAGSSESARAASPSGTPPFGPETPPFNLQAQLRPVGDAGFGLVKFRQPNDADRIVYLDVWVRDLQPNTNYSLQRAVDGVVDDNCTSTAWLTLGKGLQPQAITTDDSGTGRASLFRDLAAFAIGTAFDIHFRVVETATQTPVLASACYQFVISQ